MGEELQTGTTSGTSGGGGGGGGGGRRGWEAVRVRRAHLRSGLQTSGLGDETGEREDRVIERERERMAGWIRWEGWIRWAAGLF